MKLRKRLGWRKPHVSMHLIIMPETLKNGQKFINKWLKIVDEVGLVHYDAWAGTQPYNPKFEESVWGEPSKHKFPCHRLWTTMNVRSNGNLAACCLDVHDTLDLGNIFEDRDAYNGEKMLAFRKLHLEGKQDSISLCRDCSIWRYEVPEEWSKFWLTQKNVTSAVIPCT